MIIRGVTRKAPAAVEDLVDLLTDAMDRIRDAGGVTGNELLTESEAEIKR